MRRGVREKGEMGRKKPKFERYGWWRKKKLSKSWRRPRGHDNKMREHIAAKGARVQVGYRRRKEERGLHPSGRREVLVFNTNDLAQVEDAREEMAVRIASSVGRRKKGEIEEEAAKLGIKVLNPMQQLLE
ncbi:MAG: 50S ribosomal protein L32e [archaeon]|nr:50S ribosomal protein L32e [archaeon]